MLCEMHWVSSRIWTRVAVFISYDDNNYTTGTSKGWYAIKPNQSINIHTYLWSTHNYRNDYRHARTYIYSHIHVLTPIYVSTHSHIRFIFQRLRTLILFIFVIFKKMSAHMSSGLLQVFLVELGSLHGTLNHVLYLIHRGHLVWFLSKC